MARDKDPTPLFEIIHRGDKPARREMRLPPWMQRKAQETQANEHTKSDPKPQAPQPEPVTPAPQTQAAPEPTSASGAGPMTDAKAWLRQPLTFRLPRGTWIVLSVAAAAVVVVGYMAGHRVGQEGAIAQHRAALEMQAPLEALREQPPSSGLIPSTVAGVEDVAGAYPPPASAGAAGNSGDPRQPGLNYFRLAVLPARSREEGNRAVTFLERNGVDATLIPINNGDSLKLMVLRGFTRPYSDPQAKQLKDRIESLGRKWEAQEDGSSDWSDMFPEKYRPGVN